MDHDYAKPGRERVENEGCLCSKCGRFFSSKSNTQVHERSCQEMKHHRSGEIAEKKRTYCKKCFATFKSYTGRLKHERKCNNRTLQSTFTCPVCNQTFKTPSEVVTHQTEAKHVNAGGSGNSSKKNIIERNPDTEESDKSKKKFLKCRKCDFTTNCARELYRHRAIVHLQDKNASSSFQSLPWSSEDAAPWMKLDGTVNEELKSTYEEHKHLILKQRRTDQKGVTLYNFPVNGELTMNEIKEQVEEIYDDNDFSFKINMSFSLILQNIETEEYRFFAAHTNEQVFEIPFLVSDRRGLDNLIEKLRELDVMNYVLRQRPNTKFKPVLVTNVVYTLYKLNIVFGKGVELPQYILRKKSILSLHKSATTKKLYDDELCMFRNLAYKKLKKTSAVFEKMTKSLHSKWVEYVKDKKLRSTDVTLTSIPDVEKCFGVNINIYSLEETNIVTVIYKSRHLFDRKNNIYLNLYQNHLSYIKNFRTYAHKFECSLCFKIFSKCSKLKRHFSSCAKVSKLKFPGGYYKQKKTIFEKLEENGIHVEEQLRHFPYFIIYDMESILKKPSNVDSENITKTHLHVPISVCLCSNVEGFEQEKFIFNENLQSLVSQMLNYLKNITDKCEQLAKQRWSNVFAALDELEGKWIRKIGDNNKTECNGEMGSEIGVESSAFESAEYEPPSKKFKHAISKENVFYRFLKKIESTDSIQVEYNEWDNKKDDENDEIDEEEPYRDSDGILQSEDEAHDDYEKVNDKHDKLMLKRVVKMKEEFTLYCQKVPVIGFNSGKYDVNLIKSKLMVQLGLHEPKSKKFVIKKNNNYICIENEHFRFLDLMNYLPPGTSYDNFLSTFGVSTSKFVFPYEYVDSIDKLQERKLPPKEAFYSSLKQRNVLENDLFIKYSRLINLENKTHNEALKILDIDVNEKTKHPISTIDDNYNKIKAVWEKEKMESMMDFLKYYSKLDVTPFVEGVIKFQTFFFDKQLDIFKDFVSIPGVARKMLFDSGKKNDASFSLINPYDEDLYETFMNNLTGGPSLVFCRHHEVGKTRIRQKSDKLCQSIYGYDAASLYLSAIGCEMPVGNYVRRKKEYNFIPDNKVRRAVSMFHWMDWLNHSEGKKIEHKMNNGREFRIGPYLVDGYDPNSKEVYEFMGCYFHSCPCLGERNKEQLNKYKKTLDRLEYIKRENYKVRVIWECEFRKLLKTNVDMKAFVKERMPTFYRKKPRSVSEEEIMEAVKNGDLFGFVECDIRVPDSWEQVKCKPETNLSPYEYFEEMSPLFVTTDIPFEVIGEHMQKHVIENNLSQKPRNLLVGGMRGEKMLIMTSLLQWYINHGLLVTNITQVIEYSKKACFKAFCEEVTQARKEGNASESKKLIALLFKLIGNSGFGGTIMNKSKFKKIRYLKGFRNSCFAINDPRFTHLNEIDDDIFEAEFKKQRIVIDNPVQLGVAILNIAKLHMLQFYYDFMDKFVDRDNFEYIEMDTDSAYMALSEPTLQHCIKPAMQNKYMKNIFEYCSDDYSPKVGRDDVWFPRQCCKNHFKNDSLTPGIMKLEFQATTMTGLCSKAYVAKSDKTNKTKYSLKGINKNMLDPLAQFERTLLTQQPDYVINRGISMFQNLMYSYTQSKKAFSYFYCKREVCKDGIHTKPLKLCLKPSKKKLSESFPISIDNVNVDFL